jgi:hypothetical protein
VVEPVPHTAAAHDRGQYSDPSVPVEERLKIDLHAARRE